MEIRRSTAKDAPEIAAAEDLIFSDPWSERAISDAICTTGAMCYTALRDGKVINTYEREDYDRDKIISGMVGRELSQLYPERHVEIGEEVLSVKHMTVADPRVQGKNLVEDVSFNF